MYREFRFSAEHEEEAAEDGEDGRRRVAPGKTTLTMRVAAQLARFSRAFGVDVSSVELHRGSARARALGVEAFAEGDAIHVADAALDLDAAAGRELIGHELAHVMQQRAGRLAATAPAGGGGAVSRDPALEREADEVGARIARGEPAGIAGVARSAAPAVAQFRVGAGLAPGDPVLLRTVFEEIDGSDGEPEQRMVQGTIVDWNGVWGYRARYTLDGEERVAMFRVVDLDPVPDHDYGGRNDKRVADNVIPFTAPNVAAAKQPRKQPKPKKKGDPLPPTKPNLGSRARAAMRSMPRPDFLDFAEQLTSKDAYEILAADSQQSEVSDDEGEHRANNLRLLRETAEKIVVREVVGAALVAAGTVTFTPRNPNQILAGHRAWRGAKEEPPAPRLEVEIYGYGSRTYDARHGDVAGQLVMRDGRSAAIFVPADGSDPIEGTLNGFAAEVPGVIQLMRKVEPAADAATGADGGLVDDDEPPKPKVAPTEAVAIQLTAIVADTLHVRDEDGRFYTLHREADEATLTLTAEQARASGKPSGGFATTRTDLVAADHTSYVWCGPPAADERGPLGGRLSPGRRRGSVADAGDSTYYEEDDEVYWRTNTPLDGRYLYFKRTPTPLRWFGPPVDGERIGLRKPDYGGAFTAELTREVVDEQMAALGEAVPAIMRNGGRVAVPETISAWRLNGPVEVPRLLAQPGADAPVGDHFEKPADEHTKKVKDRKQQWRPGEPWKPQGWESRPPASKDRDQMMEGTSASAEARKPEDEGGLGVDLAHPRQEWCHLVGHGDGGSEDASNLAAGSHYANTEQLALEEGARALRVAGKAHKVAVLLKVSSYLTPGTNCADAIRYKVSLLRKDKGDEPVKIFDHLFDGQSQSFDRNEFAIAKQALIEAGARQLQDWGLDADLDVDGEDVDAWDGDVARGGADWGRFTAGGQELIAWPTAGDGNCGFNGMAQVLLSLVAEGRLTAAQVAAPLDGIATEDIAALVPAVEENRVHDIEVALAGPLRALAVARLGADERYAHQVAAAYVEELNRTIARALGLHHAGGATDLFPPASATGVRLAAAREVGVAEILADVADDAAPDALHAAADAWRLAHQDELAVVFAADGMDGYRADMAMNAQYAGGLELNAIATAYGLHLTVFQRTADGINRLGGMANAGTTVLDDWWTERRLNAARNLGLFEGPPDDDRRIAFGIASDEQIAGAFAHPPLGFLIAYPEFDPAIAPEVLPALRDRYAALRGVDYHAPIEVGMYRHQDLAHWSAMTNAEGHGDLDGEGDRLGDADIPELLDGAGFDDWYDWEPDDGGSSGGKQAKVTFARKPRNVGGTELSFADHMFERSSPMGRNHGAFNLGAVDPAHHDGEQAAVVNAANPSLHGAAGIALGLQDAVGDDATRQWQADGKAKPLPTGEARHGESGDLAAQGVSSVIHTVAPQVSNPKWRELLARCCDRILEVACAQDVQVVVVCSLGTGIYGLPLGEASQIVVERFAALLASPPSAWGLWQPLRIIFNNFPGASSLGGDHDGDDGWDDGHDGDDGGWGGWGDPDDGLADDPDAPSKKRDRDSSGSPPPPKSQRAGGSDDEDHRSVTAANLGLPFGGASLPEWHFPVDPEMEPPPARRAASFGDRDRGRSRSRSRSPRRDRDRDRERDRDKRARDRSGSPGD